MQQLQKSDHLAVLSAMLEGGPVVVSTNEARTAIARIFENAAIGLETCAEADGTQADVAGVVATAWQRAFALRLAAAENGDAYSCKVTAAFYTLGQGCERNMDEAGKWFRRHADLAHAAGRQEIPQGAGGSGGYRSGLHYRAQF